MVINGQTSVQEEALALQWPRRLLLCRRRVTDGRPPNAIAALTECI